eukprot:TRINITY_DN75200_c0_g1_i1.p1 TRINITY_DN75200_c0_g1~~TRINITY_DN75200_c0_g1_i1.p1  ORF type:complete len:325 (+),score=58.31 TRINITY_DN75200_c0_g1_i1:93-977(+)
MSNAPRGSIARSLSPPSRRRQVSPAPARAARTPPPQLGQRQNHSTRDFSIRWEQFAQGVARAVAAGGELPAPPFAGTDSSISPAAARISEAAIAAMAALWSAETEARHLRKQIQDIQSSSELGSMLFKERERNLKLRRRDVALSEKVAAARAEVHILREQDAEFAVSQMAARTEIMESRGRMATGKEINKERNFQLGQLRRRVDELMKSLESRTIEHESMRLSLQESEIRCQQLRRQLSDSETERRHVVDVVNSVMNTVGNDDVANDHVKSETGYTTPTVSSIRRSASSPRAGY